MAERLYLEFIRCVKKNGIKTEEGKFGAKMVVNITNDGPITFVLENR